MFEVNVNGRTQRYHSKPTMNADISGSSTSIPKPLTYDYMPEGYPKKDGWSVEWDGITEGKLYIPLGEGLGLCKISDMIPSDDDLLGAMVTFPSYPEKVDVINSDEIVAISDDAVRIGIEGISTYVVRKDNAYVNGITIPEKGVYTVSKAMKFKMYKENITPMSADFLPKNLNVVFRGELGHAPTSCNVTYNELRDWVERDIPVFAVFITANAKINITGIALSTDMLSFVYYLPYNGAVNSKTFTYKSDGTFAIQPNQ